MQLVDFLYNTGSSPKIGIKKLFLALEMASQMAAPGM